MFNDNQIKLSDGREKKADATATTTTQFVDLIVCTMLEPIKKEIKTEEMKRRR